MRISDWSSDVCSSDLHPHRLCAMDDRLVDRGAGGGAVAEDVDDLGRRLDVGERRDDGGAVDRLAGVARIDRDHVMALPDEKAEHLVRDRKSKRLNSRHQSAPRMASYA